MSSVRMCDRCGTIFSERSDGWSSFAGTIITRDDKGRQVQRTENQDACAPCTGPGETIAPRLAITDGQADRLAATQTQAERDTILGVGEADPKA